MPETSIKPGASGARMEIRFWGVRGSSPTPEAAHLGTGGNTACVEVRLGESTACILDLGTGARELGRRLADEAPDQPLDVHILLSHFHWDHIQAIPFFEPLFAEANQVTFYGSDADGEPLDLLAQQMRAPFFPITFAELPASTKQIVLTEGVPFQLRGLTITPFPVHHTQFVFGYRIQRNDSSVVYCTDYEHGNDRLDALLAEIAAGADLLICDAQYTPDEYADCIGWGHTTWEHAARLGARAGVKQLALFHHDPSHDDSQLKEILALAKAILPNTVLATEGETIVI